MEGTQRKGFVYIIKSEKTNRYYIGSCIFIPDRIDDHNRGNTRSTRNQGPWKLVYSETHTTLSQARTREKKIKSWKSRLMIEKLINAQP